MDLLPSPIKLQNNLLIKSDTVDQILAMNAKLNKLRELVSSVIRKEVGTLLYLRQYVNSLGMAPPESFNKLTERLVHLLVPREEPPGNAAKLLFFILFSSKNFAHFIVFAFDQATICKDSEADRPAYCGSRFVG
jgi:hypothetical protein